MSPPETALRAFGAWLAAADGGELPGLIPVYRNLIAGNLLLQDDRRLAENRWRLESVLREIGHRGAGT